MASSNTSSATSTPSVIKVFHTVELMEMILLEEDIHDLFVHQRVCKTWLDTIKGSLRLQQKMFLLPTIPVLKPTSYDSKPTSPRHLYKGQCITLNPCARVERRHRRYNWKGRVTPSRDKSVVRVLPQVCTLRNHLALYFLPIPLNSDIAPTRGADHPNASWRRMLVTQPPLLAVDFYNGEVQSARYKPGLVSLWNTHGITLGDLHDGKSRFYNTMLNDFGRPFMSAHRFRAAFQRPDGSGLQHRSNDSEAIREAEGVNSWFSMIFRCHGPGRECDERAPCQCMRALLYGRDGSRCEKKGHTLWNRINRGILCATET